MTSLGAPVGDPTVMVTLTGRDKPGITAEVFHTVARFGIEVLDIEQVVVRGRLILGLLVTTPPHQAELRRLEAEILQTARSLRMEADVAHGTGDTPGGISDRRRRAHVTLLGNPLSPSAVAAITGRIADTGANIDRILRMARYPVTAIEFQVSGTEVGLLRSVLAAEAAVQQVDVAVQAVGLLRHGRRLVVMDVDSTLLQGEAVDLLAARAGVGPEVKKITDAAMLGRLDFSEALRRRVALLAGLPAGVLEEVYAELGLAPGARTLVRTLKRLGYVVGVVSGGFEQITRRLATDLDLDFARANQLEIVDGRLTGKLRGAVIDRAGKAAALRSFAADARISLDRTVAIGDGANDLDMLAAAGLGIAFNAKPAVRDAAHTAVNVPYLDTILYLLGISREDIEEADAANGLQTPRPHLGPGG